MPLATFSIDLLRTSNDLANPNTGTWGFMTLLRGNVTAGLSYTANATSDAITTATAHGLVTGSRIRFVGGVLPTPLLASTDYFVIVSSPTVFTLAATQAAAVAGTPIIDLIDAGSGALTLTEQPLLPTDLVTVLVNKEIAHPSWTTRALIENLGASIDVAGVAEKVQKTLSVINSSATALNYQHYLFLKGGVTTLGNTTSAGIILSTEATTQAIAAGDPPRAVFFKLRARSA